MADFNKDSLMMLSLLDLDNLSALVSDVRREKAVLLKEDTKSKISEMLKAAGLSISEIFGYGPADDKPTKRTYTKKADGGTAAKTPSTPLYAHPENPSLTWTGKGRKPGFVIAHLEHGGTLEQLIIDKAA
ncbi:MAG: spbB [Cypionkella sp.]|uniref:H-NS histone family protein n=1 Tax=Cypionkella sp. TaxID=2811411 RepID=UPI00261E5BCB|nr:H-NS histone family protein [Cypionkella sp.]MDB5660709.1 spbB [Cypionkella sp.]